MSDPKKSNTTLKAEDMQQQIDDLKEQSKPMADKIWESIPSKLRNGVFICIVGIGGLGGGGSFMGYVNAQNPASKSHSVILEIRSEQKVMGENIQDIQTDQKVMTYAIESVQEDVKTNTEDIKTLLSK